MGQHNNLHRRNKHNRIAGNEEGKLKELVERFSPTAIYTETLTMTGVPSDLPSDPLSDGNQTPTQQPSTPVLTPTQPTVNTPTTPPATPTVTNTNTNTNTATNTNTVTDNVNTDNVGTNVVGPNTSVTPTNTATFTPFSYPSSAIPSNTLSLPTSASVTSSSPSATSTSEGSGTNVGGIVGGIAGALLGLAVLSFGIRFVMKRRNKLEITPFDANDFRRSAVMLDNDGPHSGSNPNGGYPDMTQHRNIGTASPAPTFGTMYGHPGPGQRDLAAINTYMANDHHGPMGTPHPYGAPYGQYSPPDTANSAHPMYPNQAYNPNVSPYDQNPFSPAPSSYNGSVPGTPSTLVSGAGAFGVAGAIAGAGMLTRQHSSAALLSDPHGNSAPNPHMSNGYPGDGGYVDLDRSSVTPFQQVQYAEISDRLGAPVPNGLSTPAVAALAAKNHPGDYSQGPFADPTSSSPRSITPPTTAPPNIPPSLAPGVNGPRGSAISATTTISDARPSTDTQDITNDFPVPPSPGLPSPGFMSEESAKHRIDSTPPTLPEIFIASGGASGVNTPQRVVSYDFPMSVGHSDVGHSSEGHNAAPNSNHGSPVNTGYPSSIFNPYSPNQGGYPSGISAAHQAAPGMGQDVHVHPNLSSFKFPATPSPLASSFGVITPEAGKARGFATDQDEPPVPATPSASQLSHEIKPDYEVVVDKKAPTAAPVAEKKRPDTLYNDDDAYGGI